LIKNPILTNGHIKPTLYRDWFSQSERCTWPCQRIQEWMGSLTRASSRNPKCPWRWTKI